MAKQGAAKAAALLYASRGWRVLPLYWIENGACTCGRPCKSPGKHPIPSNGLKAASIDEGMISRWFGTYPRANVGVATGRDSGIWALDVDGYKGGDDSFDDFGAIPEVFHTLTGGGGDHYIFAYPDIEGITVPSRVEILPGLDVRGDGGYIVMPPSNHISGKTYEFENGYSPSDEDSAELVVELSQDRGLSRGVYRELKAQSETGEPMFQSLPAWNIDEQELIKVKVALSILDADSRDDWVASGMALHATEWDQAFELWCEWSIQSDKFDLEDSRRVWRSFEYKNNGASLGSLYHLANEILPGWTCGETLTFKDDSGQVDEKTADALAELELFTTGQLLDEPIEKPESWWMDGALGAGFFGLIAGPPKVKKSFFAMGLAMSASCGGEFIGENFTRPLKVLWLQAEIQRGYLKERVEGMVERFTAEQQSLIRDNFIMSGRLRLTLEKEVDFLKIARAVAHHKPDLVMFDPLFNFTLLEENDATKIRPLLNNLDALKDIHKGLSVIVVHHSRKDIDADEPFNSIRGSGAFRGFYDFGVMMQPTPEGPRKVYFETRNRKGLDPMMLEVDDTGKWSKCGFVDDRADPSESRQVNALIDELDPYGCEGLTVSPLCTIISREWNVNYKQAKKTISDLLRAKVIKRYVDDKNNKSTDKYVLAKHWRPDL